MTPRAKAIFFDLGETLVTQNIEDSMVTRIALQDISRILPVKTTPARLFNLYQTGYRTNDEIRREYNVEIPIEVWMRQLLKRIIGQQPRNMLVDNSVEIIVKRRAENAVAFDDAHETLRRVSSRRIRLGVISNVSSHDVAVRILRKTRLNKFFDLIVTSAQCGIRKPDPGIFRYALYQLNMAPKDAIMVGDSEKNDIQGGYSVGLRTVLVNRKRPSKESLADYRFKTLSDATPTLQSL